MSSSPAIDPSGPASQMAGGNLLAEVRRVARRARRLMLGQAGLWAFTVVLSTGISISAIDFALRLDYWLLKTSVTTIWLAASGVAVWLLFRRVLVTSCDETRVACWIERRHPEFRERLSSAVAFLLQGNLDPMSGALELRQSVIRDATAGWKAIDTDRLVNRRGVQVAIVAATLAIVVLGTLLVICPELVSIGAQRRIVLWSDAAWPTTNRLQLVDLPSAVAMHSDVEFHVADANGAIPERVTILVQSLDEVNGTTIRLNSTVVGKMAKSTLHNVSQSFRVRAIGGDDRHMPWHHVTVLDVPRLTDLQIQIVPPPYTGEATTTATGHFQARVGSRVTLQAHANRPLRAANLIVQTKTGEKRMIPLEIDHDHSTIRLVPSAHGNRAWTIHSSGNYFVRMLDRDNITGDHPVRRFVAIDDQPPESEIHLPHDDFVAGTDSVIDVVGQVEDDLRIEQVSLRYILSDSNSKGEMPIEVNEPTRVIANPTLSAPADRRALETTLDLGTIRGLRPNTQLLLQLSAEDSASQIGVSSWRRVRIVDRESLFRWLRRSEQETFAMLSTIADRQRFAAADLERICANSNGEIVDAPLIESIENLRATQVFVGDRLQQSPESVVKNLESLRQHALNSGLSDSELVLRLGRTIAVLRQLEDPCRQVILVLDNGRDLLERHGMQSGVERTIAVLRQGVPIQTKIMTAVRSVLGDFNQAVAAQELLEQLRAVLDHQRRLLDNTRQLIRDTISRDLEQLTSETRERLDELSDEQIDLARRAETLLAQMENSPVDRSNDAAMFSRVMQLANEFALGGQMRAAAEHVHRNRVGLALEVQSKIVSQLTRMLETVSPASWDAGANDTIAVKITDLIDRQQQLLWQAERLEPAPDSEAIQSLSDNQQSLMQATSELANSPQNRTLAWALRQVGREMHTALGHFPPEWNQTALIESQNRALDGLKLIDSVLRSESRASVSQNTMNSHASVQQMSNGQLAEIHLLIALQKQLNERCLRLKSRGHRSGSPAKHQWQQLAGQQHELATILADIISDGPVP